MLAPFKFLDLYYSFRPSRRAATSIPSPPKTESANIEGSGVATATMSAPKAAFGGTKLFVSNSQPPPLFCQ